MRLFELQELEAATENFSPSRLIGKGSHGSVYRGHLKDGNLVAVKKLSSGLQKLRDNTKLENEARLLSSLGPNSSCLIVNLSGISQDTFGNKILVTEYLPNGTLHELVHFSTTPPPWPNRVKSALQVAMAVRFLHESNASIVHRDIKTANILFDENGDAKLADFGLATRLNRREESDVLPAGTIGYIDPNYTAPGKLSTKIDVFSYGVVLLELISGRKAIDVAKSPASIVEWALPLIQRGRTMEVCDGRVRLPRYMEGAIKQLLRLAARCLSPLESFRPSMGEIVAKLEDSAMNPVQLPLSMSFMRDVIHNMIMRRRKFRFNGNGHDRGRDSTVGGNNNMCKGTLLVREILADITSLK